MSREVGGGHRGRKGVQREVSVGEATAVALQRRAGVKAARLAGDMWSMAVGLGHAYITGYTTGGGKR